MKSRNQKKGVGDRSAQPRSDSFETLVEMLKELSGEMVRADPPEVCETLEAEAEAEADGDDLDAE